MKRFGKWFVFMSSAAVAFSGGLVADNEKQSKTLKVLTMPKSVADDTSRDSRLVVFDPKSKRADNFIVSGEVSVATITSPEAILLEVESRDEETLGASVWNAWKLSDATHALAEHFDFRNYFKASLQMSGVPEQVKFMSFFMVSEGGVSDWVVVHQAVKNGEINDDVFAMGTWICLPSSEGGLQKAISEARLVHIVEPKNVCHYGQLPAAPQLFQSQLTQVLKSKPYGLGKGSEDDPFFSRPFGENDPFEPSPGP